MSIERWQTGKTHTTPDDSVRLQPQYIEVPDTGTADSLVELNHNLNRIPRGIRIVNAILGSAATFAWYRLSTDGAWTDRRISFRSRVANARLLLEVF